MGVPEPQELTPDMVEHFQQPCAVFSQVLLQGIQQDQLTGQGFLAVQMQPGTYVGSPAADHKTKLLLLELQPQLVALACLQPTGAQIMAGSSIALKDGTQLQVSLLKSSALPAPDASICCPGGQFDVSKTAVTFLLNAHDCAHLPRDCIQFCCISAKLVCMLM